MAGSRRHGTDLSDAAWAPVAPPPPPALPGGRRRTTDLRAVLDAILHLLRTGCQWRLLPRDFPPWSTVHHYFRAWRNAGVRVRLHRALHVRARAAAGHAPCPTLVIMDGQSVRATERGGARGFDGRKRVKGRKRHILVGTLGLLITSRVGPANMPDRRAGGRLLAGLRPLFPAIRTMTADAGHGSRGFARELEQTEGWRLVVVKRRERAFRVVGLARTVERSSARPGRSRRLSKDYEYRVQTAETMVGIAAIRLMLNRLVPA